MKKILTFIVLPVLIAIAGYAIWTSIQEPVKFNKEKKLRDEAAVQRLKDIRTLQVAFKGKHGHFTSSIDSLIDYYNNGQITIIKQIGSLDDSLAVAQKRVRRDSIKIHVKDTLLKRAGFNVNDIKLIPFSGGKPVIMQAVVKQVSGVDVPLFEACVPFNDLLQGMTHQLIVNLNAERKDMNKYAGLKVGSIDAPNNNAGNWE
ncbi:MAG: hypothetical protein RR770_03485 [Bacteroidales bacterium]